MKKLGGTGTRKDPVHYSVTFPNGRQQAGFFMFRLDHVAGKTVIVDMYTDRAHNWRTLNPVFAYINPSESTDAALADPKLFVCRPPLKMDNKNLARGLNDTRLPVTTFHGADAFQHWHYMPRSGVDPTGKFFRVVKTFPGPTKQGNGNDKPAAKQPRTSVVVAMKVPYTPKLCDRLMYDLKKRFPALQANAGSASAGMSDLTSAIKHPPAPHPTSNRQHQQFPLRVIKVGHSAAGRPLWLVRIGKALSPSQPAATPSPSDIKHPKSNIPVILFYAREHADEHDGSWVAQGVIDFLLSNKPAARAIRNRFTILVIPMLDPDGAATNVYETDVVYGFMNVQNPPSTCLAWMDFFHQWVNRGNRLDLVFNIHNVESGGAQVFAPQVEADRNRLPIAHALMKSITQFLDTKGYDAARGPMKKGASMRRLGGCLAQYYGSLHQPVEVNSQAGGRHLSLYQLRALGAYLAWSTARFFHNSPRGRQLITQIDHIRTKRRHERIRYADLMVLRGHDVFETEELLSIMPYVEALQRKQGKLPYWLKKVNKQPYSEMWQSINLPANRH